MKNAKNSRALNFHEFRRFANLRENKVLAKIKCYTVLSTTKGRVVSVFHPVVDVVVSELRGRRNVQTIEWGGIEILFLFAIMEPYI